MTSMLMNDVKNVSEEKKSRFKARPDVSVDDMWNTIKGKRTEVTMQYCKFVGLARGERFGWTKLAGIGWKKALTLPGVDRIT